MDEQTLDLKELFITAPAEHVPDEELEISSSPTQISAEESHKDIPSYLEMMAQLSKSCIPLVISMTIFTCDRSVVLYFLNKNSVDSTMISAYGLATSIFTVLLLSILKALNNGLNSRCAQAYGAREFKLVGLLFHRALIINSLFFIPFLIPIFYSEEILKIIGTDNNIAHHAARYVYYSIPGLLGQIYVFTIFTILNACKQFTMLGIINTVNAGCYLMITYILVGTLNMGIVGAAISFSVNFLISTVSMLVIIQYKNTLPGVFFWPKRESFQELWSLFMYEVFVGFMSWFDTIALALIAVLSATLPMDELAGYTIGGNVYNLFLPIVVALSLVVIPYVGNPMGENNVHIAKRYLQACLLLTLWVIVAFEIGGFFIKDWLIGIFSSDEDVFESALSVFNLFLIKFPVDCFNSLLNSSVKVTAHEKKGFFVVLASDYLVLVPTAWILVIKLSLGVKGLIYSTILKNLASIIGYSIVYSLTKWQLQGRMIQRVIEDNRRSNQVHPSRGSFRV